ncbi:pirin family protein [Rhodanobacter ginsengiterrae]|uniref:pirin family protein n=1 Tax=Rhodanobacter ginsengiterrae TaxID=2008451 RepID=UPI003CFB16B2
MESRPQLIANAREHDLGDGFVVRRMLPVLQARHVGPFVFFDHMGPVNFPAGKGMDVRPHPHIGLATVTWLFDGTIRHRDSLGSLADIRPGEVNWMTSGHGITHSERTPPEAREAGQSLHGIQVWIALPQADAEVAPEFHHHGREALPRISLPGVEGVLIAGNAYGRQSPVKVFAPMFMLEINLRAGAELALPSEHAERGVHVIEGGIRWGELEIGARQMAVQAGDEPPLLRASEASRLILFGGAPLDGERHLWWNFVASSRERIEQAKADWRDGRFPSVPGDDQEFIPLPE